MHQESPEANKKETCCDMKADSTGFDPDVTIIAPRVPTQSCPHVRLSPCVHALEELRQR